LKKIKSDSPSFYQLSQKALKDFMGDRFDVQGNALTAKEMEEMLLSGGISDDISSEVSFMMLFCDSGQFGSEDYSVKEKEEMLERMKKFVVLIHKKLKK